MKAVTFVCDAGHDCGRVEDTQDQATLIAIGATRLRFVHGCDFYTEKSDTGRCKARVREKTYEEADAT